MKPGDIVSWRMARQNHTGTVVRVSNPHRIRDLETERLAHVNNQAIARFQYFVNQGDKGQRDIESVGKGC